MEIDKDIKLIVDLIEEYGNKNCTHPNDSVKLFAASRLVDTEVMIRLGRINERNKDVSFVGHCKG
jgi:hypothetical protein